MFVENKSLYFRRESVPDAPEPVPLGRAQVRRRGRDVTIVALSRLVGEALTAAERLAADGIEAEVIDPRTLVPLDLETIADSVRRTGRAVVAHEAVRTGGFGAELAAELQAAAFDYLDAPVQRVGAPFMPVPLSPPLEDGYRPQSDRDLRRRAPRGAVGRRRGARPGQRGRRGRSAVSGRASGGLGLGRRIGLGLGSSVIRFAPGSRSRTSRCSTTISRLASASRACSRARLSARAPCRRSIASISPVWWR